MRLHAAFLVAALAVPLAVAATPVAAVATPRASSPLPYAAAAGLCVGFALRRRVAQPSSAHH